ncbi:hypothetical protein ZYGNAAKF_CDS0075 [Enterococcus phage VRE9_2]
MKETKSQIAYVNTQFEKVSSICYNYIIENELIIKNRSGF